MNPIVKFFFSSSAKCRSFFLPTFSDWKFFKINARFLAKGTYFVLTCKILILQIFTRFAFLSKKTNMIFAFYILIFLLCSQLLIVLKANRIHLAKLHSKCSWINFSLGRRKHFKKMHGKLMSWKNLYRLWKLSKRNFLRLIIPTIRDYWQNK